MRCVRAGRGRRGCAGLAWATLLFGAARLARPSRRQRCFRTQWGNMRSALHGAPSSARKPPEFLSAAVGNFSKIRPKSVRKSFEFPPNFGGSQECRAGGARGRARKSFENRPKTNRISIEFPQNLELASSKPTPETCPGDAIWHRQLALGVHHLLLVVAASSSRVGPVPGVGSSGHTATGCACSSASGKEMASLTCGLKARRPAREVVRNARWLMAAVWAFLIYWWMGCVSRAQGGGPLGAGAPAALDAASARLQ